MPHSVEDIAKIATELRQDVIDMLVEAGSGHTAGSLGTAEVFASLYFNILNEKNGDKFVLSNGHICPIWYATLAKRGLIDRKDLWTLRKFGSNLQGHPHFSAITDNNTGGNTAPKNLPGIFNSSGSLGQGLSQAVGMAIAARMDKLNNRIYCLSGDGELAEGQIWEAAMSAGNYSLNNLTWLIDRNNIQTDGYTENVMPLENLHEKLESFNWYVMEIDGHNVEEIINSCSMAKAVTQRPSAIIVHTIPGKGVDFMEYKFEWHGKPPKKDEAQKALKELRTLKGKIKDDHE